jgi:hypothetical protein
MSEPIAALISVAIFIAITTTLLYLLDRKEHHS